MQFLNTRRPLLLELLDALETLALQYEVSDPRFAETNSWVQEGRSAAADDVLQAERLQGLVQRSTDAAEAAQRCGAPYSSVVMAECKLLTVLWLCMQAQAFAGMICAPPERICLSDMCNRIFACRSISSTAIGSQQQASASQSQFNYFCIQSFDSLQ